MKKKFLPILAASVLCLSVVGCGQTENTPTADEEPAQSETQSTSPMDSVVQQSITDEDGTLTAVTTAGGYEIKLSDLAHQTGNDNDPVVYYTSVIDSDALMAIYEALGRTPAEGDRVAVKLHTGEGDGSYKNVITAQSKIVYKAKETRGYLPGIDLGR